MEHRGFRRKHKWTWRMFRDFLPCLGTRRCPKFTCMAQRLNSHDLPNYTQLKLVDIAWYNIPRYYMWYVDSLKYLLLLVLSVYVYIYICIYIYVSIYICISSTSFIFHTLMEYYSRFPPLDLLLNWFLPELPQLVSTFPFLQAGLFGAAASAPAAQRGTHLEEMGWKRCNASIIFQWWYCYWYMMGIFDDMCIYTYIYIHILYVCTFPWINAKSPHFIRSPGFKVNSCSVCRGSTSPSWFLEDAIPPSQRKNLTNAKATCLGSRFSAMEASRCLRMVLLFLEQRAWLEGRVRQWSPKNWSGAKGPQYCLLALMGASTQPPLNPDQGSVEVVLMVPVEIKPPACSCWLTPSDGGKMEVHAGEGKLTKS